MRGAALFAAALLCLVSGCGDDGSDASSGQQSQAVTVKFHLADFDTAYAGCDGQGGYSDIGPGTPVTIKDGSGKVLGATTLGTGKSSSNGVQAAFCDWTVELADVPDGEDFYSAEVGSRGAITSSRADLAGDDWTFAVSLGD